MWFLNGIFSSIFIDSGQTTVKKMAKFKNIVEFQAVFAALVNEALERYGIDGLPDTCSERVVLESLLWYGSVVFFEKSGALIALPGLPTADFTLYGDPTQAIVHGRNGYVETVPLYIPHGETDTVRRTTGGFTAPETGKGVWVRENRMVFPFVNYCIEYADKISDTLRTLDITRTRIKHPNKYFVRESQVNTVKKYINSRDNNEADIVIGTGAYDPRDVQVTKEDTNPENLRDCTMLIEWYYSQFRQLEGVQAPNTVDKKAEITIPELKSTSGIQAVSRDTVIEVLTEGLDFVNKCFGTNITVYSKNEQRENDSINDMQDKSVNKKKYTVNHKEDSFNLTAEVSVTGGVNDIDFGIFVVNSGVF